MTIFLLAIVIFLELIEYLVIFDIILSWLSLLGLKFRPKFMSDILTPLYTQVQKYISTKFGAFDFTPIVIIIILIFITNLIILSNPEVSVMINQITGR